MKSWCAAFLMSGRFRPLILSRLLAGSRTMFAHTMRTFCTKPAVHESRARFLSSRRHGGRCVPPRANGRRVRGRGARVDGAAVARARVRDPRRVPEAVDSRGDALTRERRLANNAAWLQRGAPGPGVEGARRRPSGGRGPARGRGGRRRRGQNAESRPFVRSRPRPRWPGRPRKGHEGRSRGAGRLARVVAAAQLQEPLARGCPRRGVHDGRVRRRAAPRGPRRMRRRGARPIQRPIRLPGRPMGRRHTRRRRSPQRRRRTHREETPRADAGGRAQAQPRAQTVPGRV